MRTQSNNRKETLVSNHKFALNSLVVVISVSPYIDSDLIAHTLRFTTKVGCHIICNLEAAINLTKKPTQRKRNWHRDCVASTATS
jgi:hypothetical protein